MVAILAKIPQLIRASKAARSARILNRAEKLKSAANAANAAGKTGKATKLTAKSERLLDKSAKLDKAATKVGVGEKGLQVVDKGIGLTAKGTWWGVTHPVKTVAGLGAGLFTAGTAYTMATDYNKDKSFLQNVGEAGAKVGGKVVDGLGEVVDGAVNGSNSDGGNEDKSICSKMGGFLHRLPGWAKLLGTGVLGFVILKLLGGALSLASGLFSMLPMLAMVGVVLGVGSLALGALKKGSNKNNTPSAEQTQQKEQTSQRYSAQQITQEVATVPKESTTNASKVFAQQARNKPVSPNDNTLSA